MQIEKNGSGPWPGVATDGVNVTLTAGDESLTARHCRRMGR